MYHIIETKSDNVKDPETGKWSVTSAVVTPIPQFENRDKAISQWHWKCVYGADPKLSGCDIHDVMLIDHTGGVVMHECFTHGRQPEQEHEQEQEPVEEET